MKRLISLFGFTFSLLLSTSAVANGPAVQWEKTFGGSSTDSGRSVQQTTDGGYIIAGTSQSFGAGDPEVYLVKTDPNGNSQWQKTLVLSDSYYDSGYSVQQTTDGGYIIAGETYSFVTGSYDVYLIKTDPNGNSQWQKTFGGGAYDYGYSVQQTSDGGYIIAGDTSSFGEPFSDVYLVKTDPNGNSQWQKTFGGSDGDYGRSVQQTSDGGYIIAGATYSFGAGSSDVYLVKTDSAGNSQWQKTFGGSGWDYGYSVQQTSDGGYIIAGYTASSSVYLIKTDSCGNLLWQQTFGGSEGGAGSFSVQQTSDGGYIIAGEIFLISAESTEVYLIKLEAEADRDGDGLLDSWETDGIDIGDDGTIDLDLPALGADPDHKNLFVEVDAMAGRAPLRATLDRVKTAFAAVPNVLVDNPDEANGITLLIDLDETDIPLADWPNAFADFDAVKATRFGTPAQRDDLNWTNIRAAKVLAYRYCIFANRYRSVRDGTVSWTSSGLAELPGNDFMVTLGGWGTPGGTRDQQAGTFMHEFGHNLLLRHGGGDIIHHKPNYHSVMNYTWATPQLNPLNYAASWELDYSREEWDLLDEANLDEGNGIGGHVGHQLPVGPLSALLVNENGPVDWNRDGDVNDVGVNDPNINRIRATQDASPNEVLVGYNDWSNLRYQPSGHPNFQDGEDCGGVHTETTIDDEMTYEIFMELNRVGCAPPDLNCDGHVDFEDFAILGNQWLQDPGFPSADIAPAGGDGTVDFLDVAVLTDYWLEEATP